MTGKLRLLVGTKKGLFLIDGGAERADWVINGPFCEAWPIHHAVGDPSDGAVYAGGGNEWFGPAVWKSTDSGSSWTHSSEGLAFEEGDEPVKAVWSLAAGPGGLYAGVEPAGLFLSNDDGDSWRHLSGLRDHPSRPDWQPGGGGLILHAVLPHPEDAQQLWVAISVAGVYHSDDGGRSWQPRNRGTRSDYLPEDQRYPEYGQCVHSLVMSPGRPERLFQQNHCGMYASEDGGRNWNSIEAGLPSTFGFPAVVHPREPETLYLFPLNGDSVGRFAPDGKAAVWRTRDGGNSWQDLRAGLPQENAFLTVLRQAMATDPLEPAGIYFGTTSGAIFASIDEGDHWSCIAQHLPTVTSIETMVVEG